MSSSKDHLPLLNEAQVGEILGVSRAWLWRDRQKNREIPFIKLGGCIRYRLFDIESHIEKNIIGAKK
jgi:predicted DNA-binding transcriptional regulator AlpA